MLRLRLSRQLIRKHLSHGNWNDSFHKPRQRSGGSADHGVQVFRQAAPHLWSEHVWPHMRRLLTPCSFHGMGILFRIVHMAFCEIESYSCSVPSITNFNGNEIYCIFIIHQRSGAQFGRWTSCDSDKNRGSAETSAKPRLSKTQPLCSYFVSSLGMAVPLHSDEAIEVLAEPFDDTVLHQLVCVARREA